MRKTLWSDLFYWADYANNHHNQYAEQFEFSSDKFPALNRLKGFSYLEVLVLAWLILHIEGRPEDQQQDFSSLVEALKSFDSTEIELEAALHKLMRYNWVNVYFKEGGDFYYSANRMQLEEDQLFVYNKWHHLAELGLYGKISEN